MLGLIKNIGLIDRILRILVGLALIVHASKAVPSIVWSILMILLGIYLVITGLLGYSPFYKILGTHSDERLN